MERFLLATVFDEFGPYLFHKTCNPGRERHGRQQALDASESPAVQPKQDLVRDVLRLRFELQP